ncbi:hypothetical protein BCR39DRAFT_516269 [Naematelia encephala]|uniref:Uncharacterized protein n=1 Tax=Naematelia encephala TaxID=71784 RepID=A0A1Y2BJU5_9TREE|nr:hypothetical protein BCR39DRAFT_516269 [Naematelia encephala]
MSIKTVRCFSGTMTRTSFAETLVFSRDEGGTVSGGEYITGESVGSMGSETACESMSDEDVSSVGERNRSESEERGAANTVWVARVGSAGKPDDTSIRAAMQEGRIAEKDIDSIWGDFLNRMETISSTDRDLNVYSVIVSSDGGSRDWCLLLNPHEASSHDLDSTNINIEEQITQEVHDTLFTEGSRFNSKLSEIFAGDAHQKEFTATVTGFMNGELW